MFQCSNKFLNLFFSLTVNYVSRGLIPTGNSHITFACLGKWWMGKWWCTILRFDRKVSKKKNDAFLRCVDGSYNPCIETCPKFAMFCSTIFAMRMIPIDLYVSRGLKTTNEKTLVTCNSDHHCRFLGSTFRSKMKTGIQVWACQKLTRNRSNSRNQWIGLRENLQESPIFIGKIYDFL